MRRYRQATSTPPLPRANTLPNLQRVPEYAMLPARYGLSDDMGFEDMGNTTSQMEEQEYQSYITAQRASMKTDIVKYWEVRNLIVNTSYC